MSGEGTEESAGLYAGVMIGLAIDKLRNRKKGPPLAPGEAKVKEVFEVVAGPISSLEEGLTGENRPEALARFLNVLRKWRKPITDSRSDLDLVVPKTSSNLFDLLDRLDRATQGKWEMIPGSDAILDDPEFASLVQWLRYDINQWIIEHN